MRSTRSCVQLDGDEADVVGRAAHAAGVAPGRVRWDGEPAPLVRPGPQVAYVAEAREPVWSPLAERVVEAMCSPS